MADTEKDIPASSDGALPEDLAGTSDKDLNALAEKIGKEFDKINGKEKISAEDLAEMTRLADALDTIKAEVAGREAEATEREQARADLAARVRPAAEEDGETPAETPAVDAPTLTEASPVVEATTPDDGEDDEDDEEKAKTEEPVAIAASSKPSKKAPARTTPRAAPRVVTPEQTKVTMDDDGLAIVAASDIPGTPTGATLDREALAEAMRRRARSMSDSGTQALVASLSLEKPKNDASAITDDDVLRNFWDKATDQDVLVASGGWCAPSETLYDFVCDFETVDGLLSLPTITTTRGGIRYPVSPLLRDVFNDGNSGFTWTEADDIAAATPGGPTKPCSTIPCPTFEEARLQAQGICVTAGNLTDRAYPELTNRYIDLVMAAHAHRLNGLTIAKVEAESTAVTLAPAFGAASALYTSIELQIAYLRDRYYMAEDARFEVVLPRFVRAVLRADLAKRNGVAFDLVSNAQIDSWFNEIGANVQFVSDWQSFAGDAVPTTWPTEVKALIYPAGTHSKMTGGMIDLGVVRDSTLNSTNDYTAAWTEEFWQVVTRGCVSLVATVAICPDGKTGLGVDVTCPTV